MTENGQRWFKCKSSFKNELQPAPVLLRTAASWQVHSRKTVVPTMLVCSMVAQLYRPVYKQNQASGLVIPDTTVTCMNGGALLLGGHTLPGASGLEAPVPPCTALQSKSSGPSGMLFLPDPESKFLHLLQKQRWPFQRQRRE